MSDDHGWSSVTGAMDSEGTSFLRCGKSGLTGANYLMAIKTFPWRVRARKDH